MMAERERERQSANIPLLSVPQKFIPMIILANWIEDIRVAERARIHA